MLLCRRTFEYLGYETHQWFNKKTVRTRVPAGDRDKRMSFLLLICFVLSLLSFSVLVQALDSRDRVWLQWARQKKRIGNSPPIGPGLLEGGRELLKPWGGGLDTAH